jgi:hypothetical protein
MTSVNISRFFSTACKLIFVFHSGIFKFSHSIVSAIPGDLRTALVTAFASGYFSAACGYVRMVSSPYMGSSFNSPNCGLVSGGNTLVPGCIVCFSFYAIRLSVG